jgi:hypothetical protein
MPDCCPAPRTRPANKPKPSEYDTEALADRMHQWRLEAALAATEEMRAFCLGEAARYEQRLKQSFSTPVLLGLETSGPLQTAGEASH